MGQRLPGKHDSQSEWTLPPGSRSFLPLCASKVSKIESPLRRSETSLNAQIWWGDITLRGDRDFPSVCPPLSNKLVVWAKELDLHLWKVWSPRGTLLRAHPPIAGDG